MTARGSVLLLACFGLLQSAYPDDAGVIDYIGGFEPDGQCVQICSDTSDVRHCLSQGTHGLRECNIKDGKARDWDYLLLEQMFLPQYCRLLEIGVDITVSHQNVTRYPEGTQCNPQRTRNAVTIHGLWPNYIHGFPSCCNNQPSSSPANIPFDPVNYAATYPESHSQSAEEIDKVWLDPAMPDAYQSLCNIFNHEWQKHGYCLGHWDNAMNSTTKAAKYFEYTIGIAALVGRATLQLDEWAAVGTSPSVTEIRSLYPKHVELYCAAEDADGARLNRFVSVRTCWNTSKTEWAPINSIDCFAESPYGSLVTCDASRPVRLDYYARASMHGQTAGVTEARSVAQLAVS